MCAHSTRFNTKYVDRAHTHRVKFSFSPFAVNLLTHPISIVPDLNFSITSHIQILQHCFMTKVLPYILKLPPVSLSHRNSLQ